jgi:hypothetical protein
LLPLCVVQIHFSGIALTAAVVAIIAWLRPKIDWRWAAGGVVVAGLLMAPYLYLQTKTGWADFKQAMNVGGKQHWEQLNGVTTHPITGYRLPSKQNISYALAIMNAGRIEDVLGIAGGREFDKANVWGSRKGYFDAGIWDGVLVVQRLAFVAALVWLGVEAGRSRLKPSPRDAATSSSQQTAPTIFLAWLVLPVVVFYVGGLWTYLTYFAILYPAHFLVCGEAGRKLKPAAVCVIAGVFAVANAAYLLEYYRFVDASGGAQGTFGTALGYKQQAARYLVDKVSGDECAAQLAQRPVERPKFMELNHEGRPEHPQLEWPLLITQAGVSGNPTGTVILVDGNREALRPEMWAQLRQFPTTNFGPISLFFVK